MMSLINKKKYKPEKKDIAVNNLDTTKTKKENVYHKCKNWIMPPHPERYIKPRANDPL
jgi:hypothetical protein